MYIVCVRAYRKSARGDDCQYVKRQRKQQKKHSSTRTRRNFHRVDIIDTCGQHVRDRVHASDAIERCTQREREKNKKIGRLIGPYRQSDHGHAITLSDTLHVAPPLLRPLLYYCILFNITRVCVRVEDVRLTYTRYVCTRAHTLVRG